MTQKYRRASDCAFLQNTMAFAIFLGDQSALESHGTATMWWRFAMADSTAKVILHRPCVTSIEKNLAPTLPRNPMSIKSAPSIWAFEVHDERYQGGALTARRSRADGNLKGRAKMLNNVAWQKPKEVQADIFSLDGFIAWLEKQPSNAEYEYEQHDCCLVARYFTEMGFRKVKVFSNCKFYHAESSVCIHYPASFNEIAIHYPRSFGDALARARRETFA
jgi:hypothetical protein